MHSLTVVTGLWRCGSSMMMQVLKASGVIPIHKPFEDKHNTRGYYEINDRASERVYSEIVAGQYRNHCIKWLVPFWKEENNIISLADNIIFLQRNFDEIITSTEKKFGVSPYKRKLQIMERDSKEMLKEKGYQVIFLNYNEIIRDPEKGLRPIKFLLKNWKMALSVVEPSLYTCRFENEEVL